MFIYLCKKKTCIVECFKCMQPRLIYIFYSTLKHLKCELTIYVGHEAIYIVQYMKHLKCKLIYIGHEATSTLIDEN